MSVKQMREAFSLNFAKQPFLVDLLEGGLKRRRLMVGQTSTSLVSTQQGHKLKKREIDRDTPMWWALQSNGNCQVSIHINGTKMFWLGYFLRKIIQQDNLVKLLHMNQNELTKWQSDREIENYYITQADQLKKVQDEWQQGKHNEY